MGQVYCGGSGILWVISTVAVGQVWWVRSTVGQVWWVQTLEGTNALLVPEHQNVGGLVPPGPTLGCAY